MRLCGTMRYSMNKGIKGKLIMIVCLSCDCYLKLASVHNQAVLHADPDPSFQIKVQKFEKFTQIGSYIIIHVFHTFWLVICKLMRIRIQLRTLMRMRIRGSCLSI
jgi:hypothetical protein